ncbi:MAG TPA: putative toxin-antitoxin system toxin component, PIN family [Euryarchaeota archaeon]|nr:hypothetical protein BMS3Abin08_00286 [bacterium BMS3Abin08]HDL16015.1 putative toxin-antitoxin system toxin component, PIN family [Euryarchaeota archaeon]HDZ61621.1 putative toxin-antitoxin system toxin component, PIN family [Nitrospirota bacterium]
MEQNQRLRVFLDTSALIAGIVSSKGAAREVLRLAESGLIEIIVSKQVIVESDRNIEAKLPEMLNDLRSFIRYIAPVMVDDPPSKEVGEYASLINPNDAPILSAAVSSGADYLITWDRKHFINSDVKLRVDVKVVTPGEFLRYFRRYIEGIK